MDASASASLTPWRAVSDANYSGRPTCLATYKGVLSAARFPALTQLVVAIKTDIWPATE